MENVLETTGRIVQIGITELSGGHRQKTLVVGQKTAKTVKRGVHREKNRSCGQGLNVHLRLESFKIIKNVIEYI